MQDLNDLYYFARVVEHGGFAAAGRALGIPKSKLSRRVAVLEERLGVRLIRRSTRRFSVTELGLVYYHRCLAVLAEAEAAQGVIENARADPEGVIRVACSPGLLASGIGASIAGFMSANPKVDIQLRAPHRPVDVIGDAYDVVVRPGSIGSEQGSLMTRKLGELSRCIVASPAIFEGRAMARSPAELAAFPTLEFGPVHDEHPYGERTWQLEDKGGQTATVRHRPRMITDDLATLRVAALAGLGVTPLPSPMVEADIAEQRLVHILPDWQPPNELVHAVFSSQRGQLPALRAFLDHLARDCRPYRHGTLAPAEQAGPPAVAAA